jgi:serine/threonine-protein kinase HipA
MALKFEGRDDNLKRRDFLKFAERFKVRAPVVETLLDEIYEKSKTWIQDFGSIGLLEKKTADLQRVSLKRLEDLT